MGLLDNPDRCGRRHLPLTHEKLDPGDAYENMLRPGGGKNTRERGKRFTSWFKSRPGIQVLTTRRLNDLTIVWLARFSGRCAMADMRRCRHRTAADIQTTPAAVLSVLGNRVKFGYDMTLT
jgi:hypothetical protein